MQQTAVPGTAETGTAGTMGTAGDGTPELSAALAARLAEIEMEPDERRATVGGQVVSEPDVLAFRAQLSGVLYEHWHAGNAGRGAGASAIHRDEVFERDLAAAVPHLVTPTTAVLRALPDAADGEHALVEVNRVRLLVPAGAVAGRAVGDRFPLDLPSVRPMLSPGFLLTTGTAGAGDRSAVLRLYVHIDEAEHAPAVWHAALKVLEDRGAHYRAKVLSRRSHYPRRDAIVVYLAQDSACHAPDLVRALDGLPGVGADTSPLAVRVAPGLAMAYEPDDQRLGWQRTSFGQHRTMAVAHGIVRHLTDGVPLHAAVAEQLTAAGADPSVPARNLASPAFPDMAASAPATAVVLA